jgi:hypothetical protein
MRCLNQPIARALVTSDSAFDSIENLSIFPRADSWLLKSVCPRAPASIPKYRDLKISLFLKLLLDAFQYLLKIYFLS